MTLLTATEHEAREQRFARILFEEAEKMNVVASTQAGCGDITPAAADRATSLASLSGEVAAVAPPKPAPVPAAAGVDEIWRVSAVDHNNTQRTVYRASSNGSVRIQRSGMTPIVLNARETAELGDFIVATEFLRGQA